MKNPRLVSGTAGKARPAKPVPGPANPGPPIAMKRALAKKPYPRKGTNSPGSLATQGGPRGKGY